MVSLPHPPSPSSAPPGDPLPPQFTLQLGPHSGAQVATLARILRDLGAEVEVGPDGVLLAVRPPA